MKQPSRYAGEDTHADRMLKGLRTFANRFKGGSSNWRPWVLLLVAAAGMPLGAVAQPAIPLNQVRTSVPGPVHDRLTTTLVKQRGPLTPPPMAMVAQTMEAAAAFAKKPLPFAIHSPQQVAAYLTQPFQNEKLKAWVLYIWMATFISYDKDYYNRARRHLVRLNPLEVILYKKSICSGFSLLYYEMAHSVNLGCVSASGFLKGTVKGSVPVGHAWNLVRIDRNWYNLDVLCYDPLYPDYDFMQDPEIFKRTHYATERNMQLAKIPVSLEEFNKPVLE